VPNFAGMMAGNQGAPYAPAGPQGAPPDTVLPTLPALSSKYVFGTPTAPSNAGAIAPPAVSNYGVPGPGQSIMNRGPGGIMAAIPPGYQPPSPMAGAGPQGSPAVFGSLAPPPAQPIPPAPSALPAQLAQSGPGQAYRATPPTASFPSLSGGSPAPVPTAPQSAAVPTFGSLVPPAAPAGQNAQMMGGIDPARLQAYAEWAQRRADLRTRWGIPVPGYVNEAAGLPFVGPKAAATAQAQFQYGELPKINAQTEADISKAGPITSAQEWAKVAPQLYQKWREPQILRPGTGIGDPSTGQITTTMPQLEKVTDPVTGQESYKYLAPPVTGRQNGAPMGQQADAGTAGLGVAALGPGQREALVTRAKVEQEQRQKTIDEANAAQASRATLMTMANDAGNFKQGPFAQHYQAASRYIRLIDPSWNGQVASYEDFVKNAGALTRQAVKEVSSRAAVQEFNLIGNSLPNPEMSEIGLQRVQNEMIGLTDYRLAKAQAQQQWEQAHGGIGNVSGFETAFQKQASPYSFIVARMDPGDRKEMIAKLQGSDQGRQELARLGQQLSFLKSAGLAQ
jgi:hypothetical protein